MAKYLFLGHCSEAVLARKLGGQSIIGYIEQGSPADVLLHEKCRELHNECYLDDFAQEINDDYFSGELRYLIKWSHVRVASAGNAKGIVDRRTGEVVRDARITISYLLAEHAYTDDEDVVEYLLMHEMAHLLEMNHSIHFWRIVARNPNAVTGHTKYHGKSFPLVERTPFTETYIDPRSRKGMYLAGTGIKEGERV